MRPVNLLAAVVLLAAAAAAQPADSGETPRDQLEKGERPELDGPGSSAAQPILDRVFGFLQGAARAVGTTVGGAVDMIKQQNRTQPPSSAGPSAR